MNIIRFALALLLFQALYACNANSSTTSSEPPKQGRYDLSLNGYNYTSRYIDQFSVNGAGGGNIHVSSFTSGGGGGVCCTTFYPDAPNLKIKVRWQSDACRYVSFVTDTGEKRWSHYLFYKEREVTPIVQGDDEPAFMEIHIFADDHVEAYVTSALSLPRIKLKKERGDGSEYPRCPNDQKPE